MTWAFLGLVFVLLENLLLLSKSNIVFVLCLISCLCTLYIVGHSSSLTWGSLGSIYLLLTVLFHLGLAPYFLFGYRDQSRYGFIYYTDSYLSRSDAASGFVYVSTMLFVVGVGYAFSPITGKALLDRRRHRLIDPQRRLRHKLKAVVSLSGVTALCGVTYSFVGGILIFANYRLFGTYNDLLFYSNGRFGSVGAVLVIGGLCVTISSKNVKASIASAAISLLSLGALAFSGSRTFLYVGLSVTLIVLVKVRGKGLPMWLIPTSVLAFSSIGFFRSLRDASSLVIGVNPLAGMYELGGSIRPLVELTRLHNIGAWDYTDSFTNSFFVWPINWMARFGGSVPDLGLFGHGVDLLAHAWGTEYRFGMSNAAELYTNFNFPTAVLFCLIFGTIVFLVDASLKGSALGGLISMVFAFPLIYSIRQPATFLVPHFFFMLCIAAGPLLLSVAVSWVKESRTPVR